MSLLLPAMLWFGSGGQFTFGGAKPVPVKPRKFRHYRPRRHHRLGRRGDDQFPVVVFCGALCSSSLGLVARALPAAAAALETAQRMMVWGIWLNLMLCFFNLIPIPPLDGSHLLYHALPPRAGVWYRRSAALRLSSAVRCCCSCSGRRYATFLLTPARGGMIAAAPR